MNISYEDITLEYLFDVEYFTERGLNICKNQGLMNLKQILEYYNKYGTFNNIRNCGKKTNDELIEICEKYLNLISLNGNYSISKKTESFVDKINSLTPFQKVTLNRHFEYLISNLNVRSFNGLTSISESLNTKEIFEAIFSDHFNFKNIQNIGSKSEEELEKLKLELIRFVNVLQTIQKDQLSKEYSKLIVKTTFSNLPDNFEAKFENVFDESGKIRLFNLLNFLINSGQLLNEIQQKIFELNYYNSDKEHKTIESIAKETNVTRERVRQIKSKLEEDIQSYFLFISNLIEDDIVSYGIGQSKTFFIIDKVFSEKINNNENTNFNSKFYSIIFGIFLKKTHTILGDNEVIYGKRNTTNRRCYENCYLISNLLFEYFDFDDFVLDIYLKQNEKIIETYSLNFQGYIYNFIKNEEKIFYDEIYIVCEAIIYNEFELVVNSDGYLTFERNTFKQLHEYCFDILNEFSKPMSVEEIETVLNEKYPEIKKTSDSIRGSLIREKELFICFGRTSTYALKRWEVEKVNLKGGTIRDIVEEYLHTQDTPKHISEILNYVLKYRPDTNEKSVLSNIKSEKSNKFTFYSGNFFGLQAKVYSLEDINLKKLIGSHFRNSIFDKMIGWYFSDIVNHYVKSFGYKAVQIEFFIKKKIEEGEFKFSQDNKLTK
jgi:hypothetical protein